ncbi:MAG: helix-turn-helix transcriptional regulator [Candidatus Omnitrophota bacterium]
MKRGRKKKENLVDKVVAFIIDSELEDLGKLTIKGLAERFAVSHSHLSREFVAARNMKLREFVLRVKLLKCAMLMHQNNEISVKELSNKMGIENPEYFNKVFKEHFGDAPSRYMRTKN